jgi:hypothetical protein
MNPHDEHAIGVKRLKIAVLGGIVTLLIVLLIGFASYLLFSSRQTSHKIARIHVGMSRGELEGVFGPPDLIREAPEFRAVFFYHDKERTRKSEITSKATLQYEYHFGRLSGMTVGLDGTERVVYVYEYD